ncbi:protein of unknown function [Taphrina deformans PYCC 5710]|uniref:Uncharacterized protein n=1 Tax=Taphrina deformans (strain PYCC 5710 / ATCC 11124 / CBS 356.35 / IMI 108563 / JCM 9778 / NBRC 8474) TaxID=1097556 RepID=R4XHD5_TAPDE|nr:protein of unknown function [Taphrina deformans PYCC 5710]|eukprot:CCG85098.1 protein of unknown function [Taphrina deformans PYCC 5710]
MSNTRLSIPQVDRNSLLSVGLFLALIIYLISNPPFTSSWHGMDSIAVTHAVPKTVTVVHRIEFPELDSSKIFALQSSLRTLCITTCVVVSISVVAVCKYVVNPAITGRNYREKEKLMRELRRSEKRRAKRTSDVVGHENSSSEEEATVV